jgi:hypothetical protein
MPNPWLNEHKSTATMNYFLTDCFILYPCHWKHITSRTENDIKKIKYVFMMYIKRKYTLSDLELSPIYLIFLLIIWLD